MRVCVVNKDLTEIINSRSISANKSLRDISLADDLAAYEKGIKFFYEIDSIETLNGSHRQKTYYIYDIKTNGYLFGVDEKKFHKYFIDLEDYREDTINQILE